MNLYVLGGLSLLNFYAFYYAGKLSDNFLSISSSTESYNTFFYYLNSLIAFLGFFIGPFILAVFFLYLVLYPVYFKRSESFKDYWIILALFVNTAILSYIINPILIGEGTRQLIISKINPAILFLVFIFFLVLLVVGLSHWSWKNTFFIFKTMFLTSLFFVKKSFDFSKNFFRKTLQFSKNPAQSIYHKVSNKLAGDRSESINTNAALVEPDEEKQESPTRFYFEEMTPTQPGVQQKLAMDEFLETEDEEEYDYEDEDFDSEDEEVIEVKKVKYLSQDDIIQSISKKNKKANLGPDNEYFESIIDRLEDKIRDFKIDAKVINVIKGPVVDTFELELGPGVKVSKVTGITEDLSLALSGAPIRMVFPLKGKTTMGIEVPRNPRELIYLDEVLKSHVFRKSEYKLPIAMGKNAFGESKVVDLSSMPHMLVAGATGAGKSVFINTLLVSLLVKLDPSKLKLILIDPKQLELALYSRLPHLILPVMTEPKTSSISLLWACQEMERRYTILKEAGVRSIDSFNEKIKSCSRDFKERIRKYYKGESRLELPYIVIIVDEFADLILSKVGKDIETNICRLAAKARASGIHLVLATQRPSVDVITGLIKSNFPTRVSFRVTSPVDSRTILNTMGSEKLLGKGDMLYKHGIEMERLHSAYVDEAEIESLIANMCKADPLFSVEALHFIEEAELGEVSVSEEFKSDQTLAGVQGEEADPLYSEAVDIVRETKAASASLLQRRLRIGYNRAANLIEELEKNGVVGPQQGSKPRKVLI
ncbi:MAG: DNA translocase FtsK [Halobacteriovoraceae bacterium]|nr:DNA translocase FtsK [Halobacteriovoraceae bacterium]